MEQPGATADNLIAAHMDYARALTHKIARRLPGNVDVEELIGFALLGLTQAAKNFDPDMGVAFTTFSYYRIRGAVFDGIRKMTWLPPEVRKSNERQELTDDLCEQGLGETTPDASIEEAAEEFQRAVRSLGAVFLLSEASEEQQSQGQAVDPTSAAEQAESEELRTKVRDAMKTLEPRQLQILQLMYFEHQSMTDIAKSLGVNKATVSRSHAKAIEALRESLAVDP